MRKLVCLPTATDLLEGTEVNQQLALVRDSRKRADDEVPEVHDSEKADHANTLAKVQARRSHIICNK